MRKDEWTWKEWVENLDRRLEVLEKPKLDPAVIKSQAAAAQIENAANARTDVRALVNLKDFAFQFIAGDFANYATNEMRNAAMKALGLK